MREAPIVFASPERMRTCQAPRRPTCPAPIVFATFETAAGLGSSFAYFCITFFSPNLTQAAVVARTVSPLPLANFSWLLVFKKISLTRTFSILPHVPRRHSASCHTQLLTSLLHGNRGNVEEKNFVLHSVLVTASPVM